MLHHVPFWVIRDLQVVTKPNFSQRTMKMFYTCKDIYMFKLGGGLVTSKIYS